MTNTSNQRKFGVILSYISIIFSTLVGLIYTPFLVSKLGQNEYGLYSLVSSIIGYLTILDLGFGNAIVVYTSKFLEEKKLEKVKKLHGMFKLIYWIIGIITIFIGLLLFLNVNNIFSNSMNSYEISKMKIMMIILTFNLAFTFVFSIYGAIIIANERFIFQKILSILNTIMKPLIMIPLLFMGYKSVTMCICITIINVIVLLANYYYCKYILKENVRYCGIDKDILRQILKYSIWVFFAVIVEQVNMRVDQVVLGILCGTAAVSVYSIASQINMMFANLSSALSGVMLPKVSKMVACNASDEQITNEFIKVGRLQYYIIFLVASGFVLFGKEFIILWVGKDYINAYYIALILIIPMSIPLIQNLGISVLQAKNMHKFRSLLLLIIAIANVIITIPLAKNYEGIGCAIGTAISLIIGNIIILNVFYHKKTGIDVIKFWKNIFTMSIPFCIPLIIVMILKRFFILNGYIELLMYVCIYSGLYFIVCYIFDMNDYEKNIFNKIFIKIKLK